MKPSMRLTSFSATPLVLALFLAAAPHAGAQGYRYSRVGPEGARRSLPADINNAGTIIGSIVPPAPSPNFTFVKHRGGDFASFTIPGTRSAGLNSINSQGTVVGSLTESNRTVHTFIANTDGSGVRILPLIDGIRLASSGISANGQVFGSITLRDPQTAQAVSRLGVIVDTRHGDAVTYVGYPDPGLPFTSVISGNNRGMVIGNARDGEFTEFAYFTARRGSFADFGFPDPNFTGMTDINNQGDVVGYCGVGYSDLQNPFPLDPVTFPMFWSFANSRGFLAEKGGRE